MSTVEKALTMLRNLPRVNLSNIKDFPEFQKRRKAKHELPRGKDAVYKLGSDKDAANKMSRPRLGFAKTTPGYLRVPKEYYYQGHHLMRQYIPVSLFKVQHLIDTGRIDPSEPIDLTTLCNSKSIMVDVSKKQFGVQLTDEGADIFKAKINIEVQWLLSELTIAAIEKNGGTITTKFYDVDCVRAMSNPLKFFKYGKPIPKNGTPPLNALEFYTSASNRGYLANPEQIKIERLKLAQKFGYELPDFTNDPLKELLSKRKDPRQIWYGLEPGWIVDLNGKCVLKPTEENLINYYKE